MNIKDYDNLIEFCMTKEEIMRAVFKSGDYLGASKKFLELGFVDESIKFCILSRQEEFLNIMKRQIDTLGEISYTNKSSATMIVTASEDYKKAAQQIVYSADSFEESSRRIMNSMNR